MPPVAPPRFATGTVRSLLNVACICGDVVCAIMAHTSPVLVSAEVDDAYMCGSQGRCDKNFAMSKDCPEPLDVPPSDDQEVTVPLRLRNLAPLVFRSTDRGSRAPNEAHT